jgi:penicillin-binding protein 1A
MGKIFSPSDNWKKSFNKENKRRKILLAVIISVFLIIIFFGAYVFQGLPSLEQLENPKSVLASKVYSLDGELIGQFFIENRIETHLDSIPVYIQNALIATEDRKFFSHWGVDLSRLFKAMFINVVTLSGRGGGASTVTQQLAKNLYSLKIKNENSFDTFVRKLREWITAIQIEKTYTKKEILEMYLNISYFGRSAYGVETASQIYFHKKAKYLTIPESAVLVALLKSSVNYDPVTKYQNALRRRNLVMNNMVDAGYLSEPEYDKLKNKPIELGSSNIKGYSTIASHFMEYVRRQMEDMAGKYGYDLYRDGLNIYTTLDARMQRVANKAAEEHLKEYQKIFNKAWSWNNKSDLLNSILDKAVHNDPRYLAADDDKLKANISRRLKSDRKFIDSVKQAAQKIEVGFVSIDPLNGYIKAMIGGENQNFQYGLNHVTGIKRQPGSSFKPIIYTTAIDNGLYPAFPVLNQPFDYNGWSPSNSDGSTGGYTMLRDALRNSLNIITARLIIQDLAPLSKIGDIAKRMGINSELNLVPSIALGTSEVSPLELTSAYATLADKGIYHSPISILKIEDRDGILIDKFYPEKVYEAISPTTAAIVTDLMQTVVDYGTGAGVRQFFHRPAAGKTGTTQDFGDAWFIGFTPQLVAGVWIGFDDRRVSFTGWYGQGAKAAAPIWAKFMQGVYEQIDMPLKYFELTDEVVTEQFCLESIERGTPMLAKESCPTKISDIINKNNLPPVCNIH